MNKYLVKSVSLCHLQQSIHMCIVAVYAAVGQQSVHVQLAAVLLDVLHSLHENFIFKEIAILDRLGDTGQILINDTSCTHVQVTDLRVSHLSVRKADIKTAGLSLYKRAFLHQAVHNRCLRQCDCIVVLSRVQSIAIQNH